MFLLNPKRFIGWRTRGRDISVMLPKQLEEYLLEIGKVLHTVSGEMQFIGYLIPRRYELLTPPVEVEGVRVDRIYRGTYDYVTWLFAEKKLEGFVEERLGSVVEVTRDKYRDFFYPLGKERNVLVGYVNSLLEDYGNVEIWGGKVYVAYKYYLPCTATSAVDMLFRVISRAIKVEGEEDFLFDAWRLWLRGSSSVVYDVRRTLERLKQLGSSNRDLMGVVRELEVALARGEVWGFEVTLSFAKFFSTGVVVDGEKLRRLMRDRAVRSRVVRIVVQKILLKKFREFEEKLKERMMALGVEYGIGWELSPDTDQLVALGKPELYPRFVITNNVVAWYYPFSSSILASEGVYIGSTVRGADVVVNPFLAPSFNWVVTGMTGTGKSTILKYLLYSIYRYFKEKIGEDVMVFAIDPQQEYDVVARLLGADYINLLDPGSSLGLDPIRLYADGIITSRTYVVNLIEDLIRERTGHLVGEKINYVIRKGVDSLTELAERLREEDESAGEALLYVVDMFPQVFRGRFRMRDKVVYSIPGFASVGSSSIIRALARLTILPYWNAFASKEMRGRYKLLTIDEVQTFLESEFTTKLIGNMYATARKYNIAVITATQNPAVYVELQHKFGLPDLILMNAYFKVVLGMENSVIPKVSEVLNVPRELLETYCRVSETRRRLPRGEGLFFRGSDVVPIVLRLDRLHKELPMFFGSRPEEVRKAMEVLDEVFVTFDKIVEDFRKHLR